MRLTVLSDEEEAVLVESGEFDIEAVYSVEQTLGPRERVWGAVGPRCGCAGLIDDEVWIGRGSASRCHPQLKDPTLRMNGRQ